MGLTSFEADLLSVFLKNEKKFLRLSIKIKERHFRNSVLRWVYKVLEEYFRKYKTLPTIDVFKTELKNEEWIKGKYYHLGKSYAYGNISYPGENYYFYFNIIDEFGNSKIFSCTTGNCSSYFKDIGAYNINASPSRTKCISLNKESFFI